ncbi:MAG: PilZ domain-containing protein [Kiloniellales bacterium]
MSGPPLPVERQRHTRRLLLYPGELRCRDACIDCETVDLSAGGAKIRLLERFECSSPVTLTFDLGTFEGDVVWQNGEFVGIQFREDPKKVAEIIENYFLRAKHPKEHRQQARSIVMWAAKAQLEDKEINGVVLNISGEGAKVRLYEPREHVGDDGSPVTLRIDRVGDFPGKVAWQEGAMIGVDFDEAPDVVFQRIEPILWRA